MERIEKDIASGRIVLPVMYNKRVTSPSLQRSDNFSVFRDNDDDDSTCDDTCDECSHSSSSSCCSNSSYDSSEAEWESSVDTKGELIYVNCEPLPQKTKDADKETNFERTKSTRRSTRGKLLRLLRRRESKRKINKQTKPTNDTLKKMPSTNDSTSANVSNKVTFLDCQEGEERLVSLAVDPKNRIKYGRRATISEAVLGLTLTSFSDGTRLMVAGIMPEMTKHRSIKIGDWLKSINDRDVTVKTIDSVLERIKNPCTVRLRLQRIAGVEVTTEPPPNKIPKQSEFVRQLLTTSSVEDMNEINDLLVKFPVGVLFLKMDNLSEESAAGEDICYCYPRPDKMNALCKSRGAFMTLHHLLLETIKTKVLSTSIIINDTLTHVTYAIDRNDLFLLALPEERCHGVSGAVAISNDLVRCLVFMYQNLNRCFDDQNNHKKLDQFFSRFFIRLLSDECAFNDAINNLSKITLTSTSCQFEQILPAAHFVPLPRDVQLDIDDCLNDLEASDYREWNEDPIDCQRLFTVIGSSVYHAGFLLASHFISPDLLDVHAFCRQQGLLQLFHIESVKSFILWREVFPESCNRGQTSDANASYPPPKGRWFLLIVGSEQDMICVLFEAGGCTVPAIDKFIHPDPFYVEEVQYALSDIQYIGVIEVAKKWIALNLYPQVVTNINKKHKKRDLIVNKFKSSTDSNHNFGMTKTTSTTALSKKPEVTSILKRRSNSEALLSSAQSQSSLYTVPISLHGDDISDESRSIRSTNSDDNQSSTTHVVGRREARERGVQVGDESESESDWCTTKCPSHSGSNFDLSELRHTLLNNLDKQKPFKITEGAENVLFHFVQFDASQGLLLCPTVNFSSQNCQSYKNLLDNFRRCSQVIHTLFQKTIKFKNLLNHTMREKQPINKSLVAIKEHGVMFEFRDSDSKKSKNITKYWVVGRLFSEPSIKELYVCYDESIPQNMVEIAFRLDVLSVG